MTLKSDYHEMYLKEVTKSSLIPFDDKSWINDDWIETFPFGCDNIINWNYV
jgi:hypothetical protein